MPDTSDKVGDRLALRATSIFILRSVNMLARIVGNGDILRGIIFLGIVEANIRHLHPTDSVSQTYSEAADVPPDDVRKPISIHALALDLSLPYETTRRHVNRLIGDGLCVRRGAGVVIPSAVLARDPIIRGLKNNFENLRQLFRDLRDGGVALEG